MQKRGYLVIFSLLIVSMFIISGCKEGAVGGPIVKKDNRVLCNANSDCKSGSCYGPANGAKFCQNLPQTAEPLDSRTCARYTSQEICGRYTICTWMPSRGCIERGFIPSVTQPASISNTACSKLTVAQCNTQYTRCKVTNGRCIDLVSQAGTKSAECSSIKDTICPSSCAAGTDYDCCINKGRYWTISDQGIEGCYDASYPSGGVQVSSDGSYNFMSGKSFIKDGYKITLGKVGSGGDIAVSVDGTTRIISNGQTATFNGVEVKNFAQYYDSVDQSYSSAILVLKVLTLKSANPAAGGCTDSDGGINYSIKGTACSGSKCDTDSCQDLKNLMENDCGFENGVINSAHNGLGGSSYECPNGCMDGACISNQTATNFEQLEQLLRNGEYLFFDNGRLKVSCNSIRGSQSAFSNNTQIYSNGSISGFAEHYLIAGENVLVSGKKISCN